MVWHDSVWASLVRAFGLGQASRAVSYKRPAPWAKDSRFWQ